MKILIAPDKFKGSLSADEVIDAIASGIRQVRPDATIVKHPMADGGDGSLAVFQTSLSLLTETIATVDPLGRPITATYLRNDEQAFIELASASGLVLLDKQELNPLHTSTYGTGLMIRHAIELGVQQVYLFLGGSATNDMGLGIAQALGVRIYDEAGELLVPNGGKLLDISNFAKTNDFTAGIEFKLLCDVNNPTHGPNGAAHIYAGQKGATPDQILSLDQGLKQLCQIVHRQYGISVDDLPGGGAAGGVGAGLFALFGAQLCPGFQTISELTGLEEKLKEADVIISGEGKLDGQSLAGKVVDGVAALCRQHEKPLYLFAGAIDLSREELLALKIVEMHTIMERANDLEDAMRNGAAYLTDMAASVAW